MTQTRASEWRSHKRSLTNVLQVKRLAYNNSYASVDSTMNSCFL